MTLHKMLIQIISGAALGSCSSPVSQLAHQVLISCCKPPSTKTSWCSSKIHIYQS